MSYDQSELRAGTYIGKVERLRGMRALVRPHSTGDWLAQFDSFGALLGDKVLSHGWHRFPKSDFDFDLEFNAN